MCFFVFIHNSQIDGQWSDWSPFECHQCFCSDISGAIGVTLSHRNCSNPPPMNAGSECSGPANRAAVCARKCPYERQSVNQFISAKCAEHQHTRQDPELTGAGTQLSRFPQRACKVFCDVKSVPGAQRNYRFYGDDLPDGAPCGLNRYCLNGECTELSCENSLLLFGAEYDEDCPSSEERCQVDAGALAQSGTQLSDKNGGHWQQWSLWSSCTSSCGHTGIQLRSRICSIVNQCDGESSKENRPCNRTPCPKTSSGDAEWSEWTPWTQCSVSCGRGSQARYRRCTTTQKMLAFTCSPPGQTTDVRHCEELPCAKTAVEQQRRHYGQWTEWSVWSTCSSSCGPGSSVRTRACLQEPCEGMSQQKLACNLRECATWSQWGAWSDCSLLCGKGVRSRSRTCPAGTSCLGLGIEQQSCNEQTCDQPTDSQSAAGQWSDWSGWGPCSVSCGNGVRRRTRACHRGGNCAGSHFESAMCNEAECAVPDASWGGWGYWSPCSDSCGIGVRRRVRKCYGSGKCPGNDAQREQCTTDNALGEMHKCP